MSEAATTTHVAHLLPGFLVGTLSEEERHGVLAHLAGCPLCQAELAAWRSIAGALDEPSPQAPADDATLLKVWKRLDATPPAGLPIRATHHPGNGRPPGLASDGSAPRATVAPDRTLTATPAPVPPSWTAATAGPRRPRWSLAAAALLLLSLGLGSIAFGPGLPSLGDPVQQLAAPETAPGSGEVAQETLLDVVVPAAYVPAWDRAYVGLALISIPPANTSTWETPALRVDYVLQGAYRVRSAGPSLVMRRGAAPEDVPAGAELTMTAGDTLIAPAGTTSEYATDASTRTRILNWLLAEEPDSGQPAPASWDDYSYDQRDDLQPPRGALALRLLRIDLGPGASLPAPDDQLQLFVRANFLDSTIAMTGDDARRNIGETTATLYTSTISPSGTGPLMP